MSDPEPILKIDSISNPDNIWQIGAPQKNVLNSAQSFPNVIITDSVDTYPVNDTSRFTIESTAINPSNSINWFFCSLEFDYNVDSDSLSDFGLIEFSPDNGNTWIDLMNDPFYLNHVTWIVDNYGDSIPSLSGTSNGWSHVTLNWHSLAEYLAIQPGTTFIWRFSFISDGTQNNRDGLMFDNISIEVSPPIKVVEENNNNKKEIFKVFDLMGRETLLKSNTVLIILYKDGTREKVFLTN